MASPKNDYPSFLPNLWSDEIVKTYHANSLLKSLIQKGKVSNDFGSWDHEFVKDASLIKKWYNERAIPDADQVMPMTKAQRKRVKVDIGDRIYGMRITARDDETTE